MQPFFREEDAEEVDAGQGGVVTEHLTDFRAGSAMGEEDTEHGAVGSDAGSVEDVVGGVLKDGGKADQTDIQFAGAEG
jgi:hypothetical protein